MSWKITLLSDLTRKRLYLPCLTMNPRYMRDIMESCHTSHLPSPGLQVYSLKRNRHSVYSVALSLFIFLGCWLQIFSATAQPPAISEEQAWATYRSVTSAAQQCDTALALATSLFLHNKNDAARKLLLDAQQIAETSQLASQTIAILFAISKCEERDKNYEKAILLATNALDRIQYPDYPLKGKILTHLSRYHQRQQQLPMMMHYYEAALQWNDEHAPYQNWILYEQMQEFYTQLGDLDKTEETLLKAYALTQPQGNRMDHGLILYRLRQLASRKNDMAAYARYEKEYYTLTKENGGGKMIHGMDLGAVYPVDEAIARYKQLLKETEKIDFPEGENNIYARLVSLYLRKNQPQSALLYQNKIDTSTANAMFMEDYHDFYSRIYKLSGDYKMALHHAELLQVRRDQLREEQKQQQILALEAQYENEKKENQISLLQAQDEANTLRLSKSQKEKWILATASVLLFALLSLVAYLFFQNIQKNKKLNIKNDIISAALHDKDILLKEIHHRVKNNLQVVSSLLNLQSNYISDVAALEAINEGKNRVTSMALIHQNLYTEGNLTAIDTQRYFSDLIDQLFDSYRIDEDKIRLEKDIDSIFIDVDTMIPLGLVTNELISNALKHAFAGKEYGTISFRLKDKGDIIEINIADNGVGMEHDTFTSSQTFGHKMIHAFIHKLKARIAIDHQNGTSFTILLDKLKSQKEDRA